MADLGDGLQRRPFGNGSADKPAVIITLAGPIACEHEIARLFRESQARIKESIIAKGKGLH
jgi:hypothetical protein